MFQSLKNQSFNNNLTLYECYNSAEMNFTELSKHFERELQICLSGSDDYLTDPIYELEVLDLVSPLYNFHR